MGIRNLGSTCNSFRMRDFGPSRTRDHSMSSKANRPKKTSSSALSSANGCKALKATYNTTPRHGPGPAQAQARPKPSLPDFWKSGDLEVCNPKQKKHHNKKNALPKNVCKVWISRKTTLGPVSCHFTPLCSWTKAMQTMRICLILSLEAKGG